MKRLAPAWNEAPIDDRPKVPDQPNTLMSSAALPLVWFSDLGDNLDTDDFVEGLLTNGAMSVVYGESNSGKTFFCLDLGFHVATGRPWRNQYAVDQGIVIYLALEGTHGLRKRIAALKAHHGEGAQDIPFVVIPCPVNLLDPKADVDRLIEAVEQVTAQAAQRSATPDLQTGEATKPRVRLIVIDTLFRALAGGNENAAEDMGRLVMNAGRIQQETKAHMMFVHHSGKDAARGARGHSSLKGAVDTEIEISASADMHTAKATKQKDLERGQDHHFRLKVIELGTDRRGKPITSCVVEPVNSNLANSAQRPVKLSPRQKAHLVALNAALCSDKARRHPGTTGGEVPPNTLYVLQADWLAAAVMGGHNGGTDHKSQASILSAVKAELRTKGVIGVHGDVVWMLRNDLSGHDLSTEPGNSVQQSATVSNSRLQPSNSPPATGNSVNKGSRTLLTVGAVEPDALDHDDDAEVF